MKRSLLPILLMASLALAPVAMAQEGNETKSTNETPEDGGQAWTEDCPPDHMCAADEGPKDPRYVEDCQPEDPCASYRGGPSEPVNDSQSNCMDGEQEGETCRDDVMYFGNSGSPESETGAVDDAPSEERSVPAPGLALAALGLMGAALIVVGKRRD